MRSRVIGLRNVRASTLRANPKNWRTHPPNQRAALAAVVEEIGFATALLARETQEGLELIDGHLRAEVADDAEVPVLVLDVTADEATKLLATLDPIAALAEADLARLDAIVAEVATENPALRTLLADLEDAGGGQDPFDVQKPIGRVWALVSAPLEQAEAVQAHLAALEALGARYWRSNGVA